LICQVQIRCLFLYQYCYQRTCVVEIFISLWNSRCECHMCGFACLWTWYVFVLMPLYVIYPCLTKLLLSLS
jgi:uncharacterized membrane protein